MARKVIGKGLDALFMDHVEATTEKEGFVEIRLSEIEPNRDQPRKEFDAQQLEALAASIKNHGVIQPILVYQDENGFYTIIAGERRWRAARLAGLTTIPAVVREYNTRENMEIALIENLQREGLNPIEEAAGYKNLMDTFNLTQEKLAERMGKSRSAIAHSMRLLTLPDAILKIVSEGKLSGGHARALLSLDESIDKMAVAKKIIEENLSVRDIEKLVSDMKKGKGGKQKKTREFDEEFKAVEKKLENLLGTKVKISSGAKKGKIEIEYYGFDDLDRILALFGK